MSAIKVVFLEDGGLLPFGQADYGKNRAEADKRSTKVSCAVGVVALKSDFCSRLQNRGPKVQTLTKFHKHVWL